jgi:hypothetical protein
VCPFRVKKFPPFQPDLLPELPGLGPTEEERIRFRRQIHSGEFSSRISAALGKAAGLCQIHLRRSRSPILPEEMGQ